MRIKVATIDIDDSLSTIENLAGYTSVRALVRLHKTPVGTVDVPVTNGRCAARDLRKAILKQLDAPIVRHLLTDVLAGEPLPNGVRPRDLVEASHPETGSYQPFVTVAVCSRDRPDDLRLCLDALARLDYPNYEVVVVDNAPATEATSELVRSTYPNVRYVRERDPASTGRATAPSSRRAVRSSPTPTMTSSSMLIG